MKRYNKKLCEITIILGIMMVITGILMTIFKNYNLFGKTIGETQKTEEIKKETMYAINNYISSFIFDNNNLEYTLTKPNVIYAVPIDCITLEEGKDNNIGTWKPVTNGGWAYVLVYFDDTTAGYIYGFTFKDSAGYGLYPTEVTKLLKDGSQIEEGIKINKPKNGKISSMLSLEQWEKSGFIYNENTELLVLDAQELGNGMTTCTIK